MIRSNPYDAAFEAYLRARRIAYVAVDESRRTLLADASLKSIDFIVSTTDAPNLLVDVKGRKRLPGRHWENWATLEDIQGMSQWERVFGADFKSLLVFAYELAGGACEEPADSVIAYRAREYAFYGVWLEDYRQSMQQRSPRWQTVWVPAAGYRACRFPLGQLWQSPQPTSRASA